MKHFLLASTLCASLTAAQAQNTCFQTAFPVWVGSYPQVVVSADMNNDGNLDIISTSYTANMVSIRVGTGTGAFNGTSGYFTTGAKPRGITVNDFNNDGNIDVATSNHDGNNISVLLGTGTASLMPSVQYPVGTTPMAIVSADFNGDGEIDLAVANASQGNVSLLLGNGTGTFGTATNTSLGGTAVPYWMITADFNNDGFADLATANNWSNSVAVLLGNGNGSFQTVSHYTTTVWPDALVADDFNEDGQLDIVTSNMGSGQGAASLFLGTGTGSFNTAVDFNPGTNLYYVTSSDLNADGHKDLIFANYVGIDTNNVTIFYGDGTATFSTPDDTLSADVFPICVISDDYNNDGKMDLITSNYNDGMNGISDISVFLNCSTSNPGNPGNPGNPTGINDLTAANVLSVYPNPGQGIFYLNANTSSEVAVYNALGMLVYTTRLEAGAKAIMDLSAQANGLYTLAVKTEQGTHTQKLVKE